MGRNYDAALLDTLRQGQYAAEKDGVPILVKPIPEGGEDGDMDPRLIQSIRPRPRQARAAPRQEGNTAIPEQVAALRDAFGTYKGAQVVTEGVDAREISVESADGYPVPVGVYKRVSAGRELPTLVYFHGGAFLGGGVHIVDQMCRVLVRELDCVVLSVDYRLCPEAHYPQPLDDCWAVTRWAFDHAGELGAAKKKLAVSGDSAGGNLAAAVTLRDREEGTGMVGMQALIYPPVNLSGRHTEFYHGADPAQYHRSKRHAKLTGAVYLMMAGREELRRDVYLQGYETPEHIYVSPLLDDFHALPPTLLAFGEHDFLAFEDFAYARHAVKAGVELNTIVYRGLGHGFADQIGVLLQGEDLMAEIAAMMKSVL